MRQNPYDKQGSAFVLFIISDAALGFKVKGNFCPIGISRNSRGVAIALPLGFLNWVQMIVGCFNTLLYFHQKYCSP